MFLCWFISMYSDKKINFFFFFYILLVPYFVHLLQLFCGAQPKMVLLFTSFHCTIYMVFIDIIL